MLVLVGEVYSEVRAADIIACTTEPHIALSIEDQPGPSCYDHQVHTKVKLTSIQQQGRREVPVSRLQVGIMYYIVGCMVERAFAQSVQWVYELRCSFLHQLPASLSAAVALVL